MLSIKTYIQHPNLFGIAILKHFLGWLPSKPYIKLRYRLETGESLNLNHPKTFNEKLQWLKLYDQNPKYTKMVDKILVKDYVSSKLGNQYVTPLLGVWDNPEDIEWDNLPDKFVLKTNHSVGNTGVVICKDKLSFDKENAIRKLKSSLGSDVYYGRREWPYKHVEHKVFAEQYIEMASDAKDLPDYKFFCFDGRVKALFIATDRQTPGVDLKFDFFDSDFNHLPIRQGHPNSENLPSKPQSFEEMKRLASELSKGIPHVRVDFYEVNGKPIFGELTFCHFGGMVPFEPKEWDYRFGDWLDLSKCYGKERKR